jgi:hypothetical protein
MAGELGKRSSRTEWRKAWGVPRDEDHHDPVSAHRRACQEWYDRNRESVLERQKDRRKKAWEREENRKLFPEARRRVIENFGTLRDLGIVWLVMETWRRCEDPELLPAWNDFLARKRQEEDRARKAAKVSRDRAVVARVKRKRAELALEARQDPTWDPEHYEARKRQQELRRSKRAAGGK